MLDKVESNDNIDAVKVLLPTRPDRNLLPSKVVQTLSELPNHYKTRKELVTTLLEHQCGEELAYWLSNAMEYDSLKPIHECQNGHFELILQPYKGRVPALFRCLESPCHDRVLWTDFCTTVCYVSA